MRNRIVQGVSTVLELQPDIATSPQNLPQILQTMLSALQEYDQKVALSASECFCGLFKALAYSQMEGDVNKEFKDTLK